MLHRLFDQIGDLLVFAAVSLAWGLVKISLGPNDGGIWSILVAIFLAVFVGTLTGAIVLQAGYGDYAALTASSLASLSARDAVVGMVRNKDYLAGLFKRALENLVDKFTR